MLADAPVPRPPLQEYVPPPVAVTSMAVRLQVNIVLPVLLVMPAVGLGLVETFTELLFAEVQPVDAFTPRA